MLPFDTNNKASDQFHTQPDYSGCYNHGRKLYSELLRQPIHIKNIHSTFCIVTLTVNFSWTHGSMNIVFVTMTTNDAFDFCNKNSLLSWQLINSSCTCVNKLFVAINTAKCGNEDIAWDLSHCGHNYYRSNRNQVAWNSYDDNDNIMETSQWWHHGDNVTMMYRSYNNMQAWATSYVCRWRIMSSYHCYHSDVIIMMSS